MAVCLTALLLTVISVDTSSSSSLTSVRQLDVTEGRETPRDWPPCLTSDRRRRWTSPEPFEYAVVIDAGSSGSRVRIYRWPTPDGGGVRVALQAAGVVQSHTKKIEPGLSSHASDLERVSADISTLLTDAAAHLPSHLHRRTPVFIMATAGMRLLLEDKMNSVVQHIDSKMRNSSFNPFHYRSRHSTRILSGEEEGVFAWIAVNYLVGVFDVTRRHDKPDMVGILEMGGASTQIAFAPEGDVLAAKFPVLIGGRRYPLYVHSYLYYGQNAVDQRVKERLAMDHAASYSSTSSHITNPCMLRGDHVTYSDLGNKTFIGSGNPTACRSLLEDVVHKANESQCYPKPCGIGVFYQPTITSNLQFYAVGSFRYALRGVGAVTDSGIYVPRVGFEKAAAFCSTDIDELLKQATNDRERRHIHNKCIVALYAAVLFTRGYGFANDSEQIHVLDAINDQPLDWSLGAVLYEDELDAINACGNAPITGEVRSVATGGALVVTTNQLMLSIMSAVYVVIIACRRRCP